MSFSVKYPFFGQILLHCMLNKMLLCNMFYLKVVKLLMELDDKDMPLYKGPNNEVLADTNLEKTQTGLILFIKIHNFVIMRDSKNRRYL